MKSKTRKIIIKDNTYIWIISKHTVHKTDSQMFVAETKFSAYSINNKRAPLRVIFTTWDDLVKGNPLHTGWETTNYLAQRVILNINHPSVARELIEFAQGQGWAPEKENRPLTLMHGLDILAQIGYDVSKLHPPQ